MKDIAKMAGVSYGTVSNVLNGRGNVSAQKIKLVEDTAKQLGYSINAQARNLRCSSNLSSYIAVVLPNIVEEKYSFFYTTAQHHLEQLGYTTLLFVTEDMPYHEAAAAGTIAAIRAAGVIAISCCHNIDEVYAPLVKIGSRIVFAERQVPAPYHQLDFDLDGAAGQIAERIAPGASVGVLSGVDFFANERAFVDGLRARLNPDALRVMTSNINTALKSAYTFITDGVPDVIVTTSTHLAKGVEMALDTWRPSTRPHMISLAPTSFLSGPGHFEEYYLDYRRLGARASQLIHDCIVGKSGPQGNRETLPCEGFAHPSTFYIAGPCKLQVLMVQNQSTEALMKLTPGFTRQTNIEIAYTVLPIRDMFSATMDTLKTGRFDVIRVNIPTFHLLEQDMLHPIPPDSFARMTATMYERIVSEYSYIGGEAMAVPFDVGLQLLVYRRDLFEDPMIKRMYFEACGEELCIPRDFREFNRIARFFTEKYNPRSPIPYGTSFAMGTDSDILDHYLLKLMSFGGRFVDSRGHNTLDEDIALKALDNYRELMDYSLHLTDNALFGDGIYCFIEGSTAMEIVQTNYASNIIDLHKSRIGGRIGYGQLPVPNSLFGGGSLAIPKSSHSPQNALQFIEWASDQAQAELYTFLGGNSAQKAAYDNEEILQVYPWYSLTGRIIDRSVASEVWGYIDHEKIERFVGRAIQAALRRTISDRECIRSIKASIDLSLIR